jgi:AraC-like DNA-binding protein
MIYEKYIPVLPLNKFVESFVYFKNYEPDHSIDRFLPDGNINVIIDFTGNPMPVYDNYTLKEIQVCRNIWISGIRNNFITIPSGSSAEMLIINFQKGKAYPFIEIPVNEITNYILDAELVMNKSILNIREEIEPLTTAKEKFLFLEKYLLKSLENKFLFNTFVEFATNEIIRNPYKDVIKTISGKAGYSHKHMIKLFKESVGVAPKIFLKIIRFQKAVYEIERSQKINWQDVAYKSGYYDQAHFINEFKKHSGFTPSQYLNKKREFTNYVAID